MNPGSIWISEESEVIKQQEQMSGKKDQQMGDNTDMWQLEQREHTMMDIEQNCIEKGRKVDQGGEARVLNDFLPEDVVKEMEQEGISKKEVMQLLSKMEMVGECGDDMMGEDSSVT
jgi:hypothetical protein